MKDRDTIGRFAKGNKGGPGRPRAKTDEYKAMMMEGMPEVIAKLMELAKSGDLTAIRLVLERMYPAHQAQTEELAAQLEELRAIVNAYEQAA